MKKLLAIFFSLMVVVSSLSINVFADQHITVTYQTYDETKGAFLPNVTDTQDYAGVFGHSVDCVYASLSQGNITYKVHVKGGNWLPEVKNRTDYAGIKGKTIDGLMVKTDTGKTIKYRVHIKGGNWLSYVSGYNQNDASNGYAGNLGQAIDAIQMYLEDSVPSSGSSVSLKVPLYSQASTNITNVTGSAYTGCTLTSTSMAYDYKYGAGASYNNDSLLVKWWGGRGTGTAGMIFGYACNSLSSTSISAIDYSKIYQQLNLGVPVIFYAKGGSGSHYAHAVVIKGYTAGTTSSNINASRLLINDPGNTSNTYLSQMLNTYSTCTQVALYVIK